MGDDLLTCPRRMLLGGMTRDEYRAAVLARKARRRDATGEPMEPVSGPVSGDGSGHALPPMESEA